MNIENPELLKYIYPLLKGALVTLKVTAISWIIGIILGTSFAIAENSRIKLISNLATHFTNALRSLPELIILFGIYFGGSALISELTSNYIEFDPTISGIVALSLLFGSYSSKVIFAALIAIPSGQIESAKVLGMTKAQIFFHIQLPQLIPHAFPGIINLTLVLLKDSSLLALIGVPELMHISQRGAINTQQPALFYSLAALIYLLFSSIILYLLKHNNKSSERK